MEQLSGEMVAQAPRADGVLEHLTALLGSDVFFVPCEWGTKKPLVTYVERPFEGTKSPAYRALFDGEPRNIAVYLGKASGGLCAIDFDAKAWVKSLYFDPVYQVEAPSPKSPSIGRALSAIRQPLSHNI